MLLRYVRLHASAFLRRNGKELLGGFLSAALTGASILQGGATSALLTGVFLMATLACLVWVAADVQMYWNGYRGWRSTQEDS